MTAPDLHAVTPRRIRLQRMRGFRLADESTNPNGVVKVDRTTRWGNPFVVGGEFIGCETREDAVEMYRYWLDYSTCPYPLEGQSARLSALRDRVVSDLHELAGKDLACWCKPTDPCHADVLLELSNPDREVTR